MPRVRFLEAVNLRFPPGTLPRIHQAAMRLGTTSAEFMRQAIRRALETAEGKPDDHRL
jgi:predicted DNA-binding protein